MWLYKENRQSLFNQTEDEKMYNKDGYVCIEDDDQCITCENFNKGVACPLLHALGVGLVSLTEELRVTNCGFYKKFERHLKLVRPINEIKEIDDEN